MLIEEVDDTPSLSSQLGFCGDDVQVPGWMSWLDSTAAAISSIKQKVDRFKNTLLGRAVASGVQSSVAEGVGSYVGGALVSRVTGGLFRQLFVKPLGGPGVLIVSSASALILMNNTENKEAETRKWAMIALTTISLSSLMIFLYPDISLAAGIVGDGLGYIVGAVLGGHLGLKAVGQEIPLIDFERPIKSYVARALPSVVIPAYLDMVQPIRNTTLSFCRSLIASNAAYYAAPMVEHGPALMSADNRFKLLAAPEMMRSFLAATGEQGLEGYANYLASAITANELVKQFIGDEVLRLLNGDAAYNIVVRTLNHYNEFLQRDPEIQQALEKFREAFDRGEESDELSKVLSRKMAEKFSGLSLIPNQVNASLKAVSQGLASTVVGAIRSGEPQVCGFCLTSENDLAYLERFLTVYLDSFLPYGLMQAVAFQGPLNHQETQLFYRNLNQMVQQLYVRHLPIGQRVAGLIESGVDRVIEEVLPLSEKERKEPVKEPPVSFTTWLLNVVKLTVQELYRFFKHLIYHKTLHS